MVKSYWCVYFFDGYMIYKLTSILYPSSCIYVINLRIFMTRQVNCLSYFCLIYNR